LPPVLHEGNGIPPGQISTIRPSIELTTSKSHNFA
jgi:hypothetical protein